MVCAQYLFDVLHCIFSILLKAENIYIINLILNILHTHKHTHTHIYMYIYLIYTSNIH
jgi:hypothetical protein